MMQREKNIGEDNLSEKLYNIPFKIETFNDMPFRILENSGLKVPNIGLGTWKIGYPQKGDGSRINEKNAFEIFDKAIELGVTFWDTANRYNNASGNSERAIGRWLQNNPDQSRNVILSSKLGGCMDGLTPNHCGLSRANIIESVQRYLNQKTIGPGDRLFDEGKIKNDSNIPGIKKIQRLAELSAEWGMKLNKLVISYMLTLPGMGPVISSSSNVSQLSSNASSGKAILNDEQRKRIKQVISI